MKNKFLKIIKKIAYIILEILLFFIIIAVYYYLTNEKSREIFHKTFFVDSDTKIDPNSELAKYVTQEEVDDFAFRYWDIDIDEVKNNPLMENFRQILKSKNTTNILNFMKDNNLSANTELHRGVTPLMYSSFYNDLNTTKELIKLGANVHKKDKYGLSPLAYAIENNSTKTVKILLDNGVGINEVDFVQFYLYTRSYRSIDYLIIDNDKIELKFSNLYGTKNIRSKDAINPFAYAVNLNLLEMTKIILESGYKPEIKKYNYYETYYISDKEDIMFYKYLIGYPNFEPMLNLLLEHNVSGQPSKELLKEKCLNDCSSRYRDYIENKFNLVRNEILKDYNDETKLIKLDFYYKDYNETIKLINDNKLETIIPSDEILEEFDYLTNEIKWYAKYCAENYMEELKDFTGAGDLFYWTWKEGNKYSGNSNVIKGYENSKATFKDTREFVTFYNERNKRLEIIGLLYSYENCDDKNSPNYKGKEECKYYEKRVYKRVKRWS